jgi:hypothetical protein
MKIRFIAKAALLFLLVSALHSPCVSAQTENNSPQKIFLHYTISAGITYASCRLITNAHPEMSLTNRYLISAGIGLAFGIGKEVFDELTGNNFDLVDLGIDILGVASGLLLHYCIIDKKSIKGDISFNITDPHHFVSVKFRF